MHVLLTPPINPSNPITVIAAGSQESQEVPFQEFLGLIAEAAMDPNLDAHRVRRNQGQILGNTSCADHVMCVGVFLMPWTPYGLEMLPCENSVCQRPKVSFGCQKVGKKFQSVAIATPYEELKASHETNNGCIFLHLIS